MDPVEPWIDGNAVRRMAAQLLSSPESAEIADKPDAGFGPRFEGFTSAQSQDDLQADPAPQAVAVPEPVAEFQVEAEEPPPVVSREPSVVADPPAITEASEVPPIPPSMPPVPTAAPAEAVVPSPADPPEVPDRAPQQMLEQAAAAVAPPEPEPPSPKVGETEAKPFLAAAEETSVRPQTAKPAEQPSAAPSGPSAPSADDQPFQNVPSSPATTAKDQRRGPLMERMLRFSDWLRRHAGARSVFVLDRDGQAVLDDPAYGKLHFLARSLSQAYRPVPGQPGNVHVKVGSDAYLVVVPVETAFGTLVLGIVLPRPLDAPSVEIVAKALAEAAKPRPS